MDTLLLYWFRTPPYVKVGRTALDDEARERLELQYPDIKFDWDKILREPPQALTEQEAARRRDHRDARDARRKRKRPVETREGADEAGLDAISGAAVPETAPETPPEQLDEDFLDENGVLTDDSGEEAAAPAAPGDETPTPHEPARRRRRRRRRGKRRPGEPGGAPPAGAPPTDSV